MRESKCLRLSRKLRNLALKAKEDELAFKRLLSLLEELVRAVARNVLKQHGMPADEAFVDDVWQQFFFEQWQNRVKVMSTLSPDWPWACWFAWKARGIAERMIRTCRSSHPEPAVGPSGEMDAEYTGRKSRQDYVTLQELFRHTIDVVLSPEERRVMILRLCCDCPCKDVANILQFSHPETVARVYQRAVKKIRDTFEERGETG